ncbi:MAG: OmpA family protein [bacterium]|nr:OmpA family protein [bacterium]
MVFLRCRSLLGVLLVALFCAPSLVAAQDFVVFKVKTPFQTGGAVPDSARMNDFYCKIGTDQGIQIGTEMNVYRQREIASDFGNFKIKTKMFVGRMKAFDVQDEYTVGRVSELASYSDPHRNRDAVLIGDYVQPVFVVESENLFDQGSSTLRPEAIRELDRAAAFIKRFGPSKVRIEGHSDNVGDEDFNLQLSEGRAKSVRNYLVSQAGFDENKFITVGYGESKPIAPNDTPEGQRKNRRFEIVIEQ